MFSNFKTNPEFMKKIFVFVHSTHECKIYHVLSEKNSGGSYFKIISEWLKVTSFKAVVKEVHGD